MWKADFCFCGMLLASWEMLSAVTSHYVQWGFMSPDPAGGGGPLGEPPLSPSWWCFPFGQTTTDHYGPCAFQEEQNTDAARRANLQSDSSIDVTEKKTHFVLEGKFAFPKMNRECIAYISVGKEGIKFLTTCISRLNMCAGSNTSTSFGSKLIV